MTMPRSLIWVGLMLMTGAPFAQGTSLMRAADFVSQAQEKGALHKEESVALDKLRAQTSHYRNIIVMRVNSAALGSGLITLVMPDGVERKYVGTGQESIVDEVLPGGKIKEHKVFLWSGKATTGLLGLLGIDALTLGSEDGILSGTIRDGPKYFQLIPLTGGRLHALAEIIPPTHGIEEPPPEGRK
jgi:hypothetical protein